MVHRDLEDFEKWDKSRNSTWGNFKKSLQPIHLIGLATLGILGFYLIQNSSGTTKYIVIGAIVLVVIVLIFRPDKKDKIPIPESVIKVIGLALMRRKIGNELETGTQVLPTLYCKLRFQGEWGTPFTPWKWEVGFIIVFPDGRRKYVLGIFHPYEGYITGLVEKPAGYNGEDSNDLKVLMPTQFAVQEEKKPIEKA